jgi:ABC-type uncharacterized transport system permease subunit
MLWGSLAAIILFLGSIVLWNNAMKKYTSAGG